LTILSILKADYHFTVNPEKTSSPFALQTTISRRSILMPAILSQFFAITIPGKSSGKNAEAAPAAEY
jgi:hypothetical protein